MIRETDFRFNAAKTTMKSERLSGMFMTSIENYHKVSEESESVEFCVNMEDFMVKVKDKLKSFFQSINCEITSCSHVRLHLMLTNHRTGNK